MDENAFQLHRPNWKGDNHRSKESSDRAKTRAVSRNVNSILEAGDDDQIALGLRETINHPQIRPYATRVWGQIVSEEASVGLRAVQCMREMTNKIADSKNNGMLSKTCRSFLDAIGMCLTKGDNTDKGTIRAIERQILPAFSHGAAQRILRKAGKKRKRLDQEGLSQFSIVQEEEERNKYSPDEKEELREWMVSNIYTRDSPMKDDTVMKRDVYCELFMSTVIFSLYSDLFCTSLPEYLSVVSFLSQMISYMIPIISLYEYRRS